MTETGCKNLYGTCSFSITTFVVLACAASAVSAGTFAEFEARCLTPMVEVRETGVDGLERIPHRAAWESWVPAEGDWELRRALPGAVVQYCAIIGEYTQAESEAWVETVVASGDYEVIETEPLRLHSTFIREPVIEVEFDILVPSVTVIETNLES